tara:strand:- start:287 stop:616 length:330 start_codon:yes stop_codon:yes gene_type:complete
MALFILYLFPGSLIGYFLYGDLSKQPNIVETPIGTSVNHFFYFVYLTIIAVIINSKQNQFFTNFYFIFSISILLEASHYIIPNRAFEYYDLLANTAGVLLVFLLRKVIK